MDAVEAGKRVRAARAYLGMSAAHLADVSGIGYRRLRKAEAGERRLTDGELERVAELCGVPAVWFTAPWDDIANPRGVVEPESSDPDGVRDLVERVDRLADRLDEVERRAELPPDYY